MVCKHTNTSITNKKISQTILKYFILWVLKYIYYTDRKEHFQLENCSFELFYINTEKLTVSIYATMKNKIQ